MLDRLLRSIVALKTQPDVDINIVVVENGLEPLSSDLVEKFQNKLKIEYALEPKIGLVFARNRAIELSLLSGAEWIAFVDDDEWVDPDWLLEYLDAIEAFPLTRAFAGPIDRIAPQTATKWFPANQTAKGKTGSKVWNAGTGNIMFHRSIYSSEGDKMRFDERFNLSGGEDTFLFLSMRRIGIQMLWVQGALCSEDVLPERATLPVKNLLPSA